MCGIAVKPTDCLKTTLPACPGPFASPVPSHRTLVLERNHDTFMNHRRSRPFVLKEPSEAKPPPDSHKRGRVTLQLMKYLLIVGLTGCASLPNVGPFVDASNQLRSAVATSGTTVEAELRLIPGGAAFADQLEQNWEARNKAFAAMAGYSSSLKAIVDAGHEGAVAAQKVADSVSGLAKAAGLALPGSPEAVAVATDIVKFISAQIALARAARSLDQAMEAAQPAVEAITRRIGADLKDLEEILVAASKANDNAIRTGDEFKDLIGYRNQLLRQMGTSNPADAATLAQQVQLGQLLESTEAWHSRYLARRKETDTRLRLGRALIQTALQSANDWGMAHGNLIMALKERRPANTDSLIQAAAEIQGLIRKVREL